MAQTSECHTPEQWALDYLNYAAKDRMVLLEYFMDT